MAVALVGELASRGRDFAGSLVRAAARCTAASSARIVRRRRPGQRAQCHERCLRRCPRSTACSARSRARLMRRARPRRGDLRLGAPAAEAADQPGGGPGRTGVVRVGSPTSGEIASTACAKRRWRPASWPTRSATSRQRGPASAIRLQAARAASAASIAQSGGRGRAVPPPPPRPRAKSPAASRGPGRRVLQLRQRRRLAGERGLAVGVRRALRLDLGAGDLGAAQQGRQVSSRAGRRAAAAQGGQSRRRGAGGARRAALPARAPRRPERARPAAPRSHSAIAGGAAGARPAGAQSGARRPGLRGVRRRPRPRRRGRPRARLQVRLPRRFGEVFGDALRFVRATVGEPVGLVAQRLVAVGQGAGSGAGPPSSSGGYARQTASRRSRAAWTEAAVATGSPRESCASRSATCSSSAPSCPSSSCDLPTAFAVRSSAAAVAAISEAAAAPGRRRARRRRPSRAAGRRTRRRPRGAWRRPQAGGGGLGIEPALRPAVVDGGAQQGRVGGGGAADSAACSRPGAAARPRGSAWLAPARDGQLGVAADQRSARSGGRTRAGRARWPARAAGRSGRRHRRLARAARRLGWHAGQVGGRLQRHRARLASRSIASCTASTAGLRGSSPVRACSRAACPDSRAQRRPGPVPRAPPASRIWASASGGNIGRAGRAPPAPPGHRRAPEQAARPAGRAAAGSLRGAAGSGLPGLRASWRGPWPPRSAASFQARGGTARCSAACAIAATLDRLGHGATAAAVADQRLASSSSRARAPRRPSMPVPAATGSRRPRRRPATAPPRPRAAVRRSGRTCARTDHGWRRRGSAAALLPAARPRRCVAQGGAPALAADEPRLVPSRAASVMPTRRFGPPCRKS